MSDSTVDLAADDDDGALGEHVQDGPSGALQDLLTLALAGPSVRALLVTDAYTALIERIALCSEWSDLDAADAELLQRGIDETRAGQSLILITPESYGSNWALEDLLADAAFDAAAAAAAAAGDAQAKTLPDLDPDEWVGLG